MQVKPDLEGAKKEEDGASAAVSSVHAVTPLQAWMYMQQRMRQSYNVADSCAILMGVAR